MKKKTATPRKDIIASRKSCDPKGTGLSHYILSASKKAK
ncbi:MAG: modified peptide precursor CbpA [Nitrospinae bacterium]|nr:modified peptide precursor CbpA [Nitrospinota bacterium]